MRSLPHWTVHLSGEIHTDWRSEIAEGVAARELPIDLTSPVTDHDASDHCGVRILGEEDSAFWRDRKGALINGIRTRTLIQQADLVVVRFGTQYKQWNAAFDAGLAVASDLPLIVLHPQEHDHALKEIDAAAAAVARTAAEVVEVLAYVTTHP